MTTRLTIRSNIASLQVQRRLGSSTEALQDSFTRLSSGLRINRASDDAAGLSIANSLEVERKIQAQGVRNANDGISALRIADGALDELSLIVTRISELAEQASNGIYSNDQRSAMNDEAQALSREFSRISSTTEFNGINLLDGSTDTVSIQVGTDSSRDSRISVSLTDATSSFVGDGTFNLSSTFTESAMTDVTAADFNNDGLDDLVVSGSNDMSIYLSNGDGTFSIENYAITTGYREAVAVGDVDNDGDVDFVAVRSGATGLLTTGLNDGSGNFTNIFNTNPLSEDARNYPILVDVNGDQVLDLIDARTSDGVIEIMIGVGDGTFNNPTQINPSASTFRSLSYGDLNNDGIGDILATFNDGSGAIASFYGQPGGTFSGETVIDAVGGSESVRTTIGDMNGDGINDIISRRGNSVDIYIGNGDGSFNSEVTYSVADSTPLDIFVDDVNGDGVNDVITTGGSNIQVALGAGDGTLLAPKSFAGGSEMNDLILGDFNGDGVIDVAGGSGAQLNVFLGGAEETVGLGEFNLSSQSAAREALDQMATIQDELSMARAELGVSLSRLSVSITNGLVKQENLAAAESQIRDVDVATEAANLTKLRIQQNVATALLAQANNQPQLVLSLLQI